MLSVELFNQVWDRLAEEGACDGHGSSEHVRVLGEWRLAGRPPGIELFIRWRANLQPALAETLALENTLPVALGLIVDEIRWAGVLAAAAAYYSTAEVRPEEIIHLARRLDDARPPKGGGT